jgi:dTDP-glucose pyrophosphorylase
MELKKKLKNLIVSDQASINSVLELLDNTGKGCLLVIKNDGFLIGTITDGDVRRKLIEGKSIKDKIIDIYNRKPKFFIENKYNRNDAKKLMLDSKINLIPIINKHGLLVDYITLEDILTNDTLKYNKIKIPVVIMAGGKGTRLKPFTNIFPKPLLPIKSKTIFEHIVHQFEKIGCNEFFLTLNYKSNLMKSYIKDLSPGYKVHYVEEKKPLGTAGGLKLLNANFSGPFFVTNCDIIIRTEYRKFLEFHKNGGFDLSLIAAAKNYTIPYGTCKVDKNGSLLSIDEKPVYNFLTNTGLYLLNPNILEYIPNDRLFHITHLISKIIKNGKKVGVFPVSDDSWIDVGQWKDYEINKDSL